MEGNLEFVPERRRCLRQKVHAPAFASFDGVSGGMILDLSEDGLSMQMGERIASHIDDALEMEKNLPVRMELDFTEPSAHTETTGYIAWADALGRAGVRFSDLPDEARQRLNDWLTVNASAPSHIAPKVTVGQAWGWGRGGKSAVANSDREHMAVNLEVEPDGWESEFSYGPSGNGPAAAWPSATVQYEFSSLGSDLTAALRQIGERARALTRGTSAAIALVHKGGVICRASVGGSVPSLGTPLDVNSGLSGQCFREGKPVRCDDAEHDLRVDLESCRRLGVRSFVAAPVRYERQTIGLLMVVASEPFNFDEGDVAVVESLAHTVVRSVRESEEAAGHGTEGTRQQQAPQVDQQCTTNGQWQPRT
jgi:GAF domain-containing protein